MEATYMFMIDAYIQIWDTTLGTETDFEPMVDILNELERRRL